MSDYDTEPYQKYVNQVECKHCGGHTEYDFCSNSCSVAYFND
jgi:hypothetical protein